jgi:predicted permease
MVNPLDRLARLLLRAAAAPEDRQAILADLDEETAQRAARDGAAPAARWSRRQALASIAPLTARRAGGALTTFRSACMSIWRGLGSDVRLAGRRLRQAPAFAAVCIFTLALGIGANTAVFTLIDRVMLEPLPVPRPSELYRLGDTDDCCVNSGLPGSFSLFSYDLYQHLAAAAAPDFTAIAAFQANTRGITIGRVEADRPAEVIDSAFVSGSYFEMFEVVPAAGRLLRPDDDRPGAAPLAVLSDSAWARRFGRAPSIVGSTVTLNGVPVTIAGVAPKGFYGEMLRPDPAEIWIPLSNEPAIQPAARLLEAKGSHWLYIMGRLRPGTPLAPIEARLDSTLRNWISTTLTLDESERPEVPRQHVTIVPAPGGVNSLRDSVAPSLRLLQGIAAAVLLIACANLANLLLVRGLGRRTETAVRCALGAPRARLMAQFIAESVVLAVFGGLAGLAVAYGAARAIVDIAFEGAPAVPIDTTPSLLVIGFAFAVSLATGVAFGVLPAILGSRAEPVDAMRGAGRTAGERGTRLRRSLIVVQVALSLVLATCAGLLARSLHAMETQDFGFRSENRYLASLGPSLTTVPPGELPALYARIREGVARIPGVTRVGYSLYAPMSGDNWASRITIEGHDPSERATASWNRASPGYFETIGTPLLRGRAIDERDTASAPAVTVVTQSFAEKFFPGADPIGRRIGFGSDPADRTLEIVGVVGDAKYSDGRGAPRPTFFLPFLQQSTARVANGGEVTLDRSHFPQALEVQAARPIPGFEGQLRQALAGIDRRLVARGVMTLDDQVGRAFTLERLIARLTLAFGMVALLLACLGLYGVTAYSVTRRTREIGIRMAIGASRGLVLRGVLRSALLQLAIGIAIGLPAAVVAGRLLQSNLFGVSAHDPVSLALAIASLGAAAIFAAIIPARRAAGMDPVRALRLE